MIEEALRQNRGVLSRDGALIVETGKHTGRVTDHKYIVRSRETEDRINWSKVNQPIDESFTEKLFHKLGEKIQSASKFYSFEGSIGGFPIVVRSMSPWHVAFAENMFREMNDGAHFRSPAKAGERIQIFHDPYGKVSELGLEFASETVVILDPERLRVAIIGTAYAGEIKKSAFTLCNYRLPAEGYLPMHASANCLEDGSETSLLFGLSGTGKTTLSAAPDRFLIGDDEIIWTPQGIFNLEAGCYAKLINLSPEREPEIYQATNRFGAILENVAYDRESRRVDFSSSEKTENTRGSYSLQGFPKVYRQDVGAEAPKHIIFLMADAFGAMPAVARLDPWQAQYHFLSGYTAKVAGTEIGIKEPKAAFSTCFGEPFMPLHPQVYAKMLSELAEQSRTKVWLLNTGWTRGGYGKGERFPLKVTRTVLSMIQSGELEKERCVKHPTFGFEVPVKCPDLDSDWLKAPESQAVGTLAGLFQKNIERFSGKMDLAILNRGGPQQQALAGAQTA